MQTATATFLVTVFFPLIYPVWQTAPLDEASIKTPAAIKTLANEEVAFQKGLLASIKDPRIRAKVARDLSDSNNNATVEALEPVLKTEKNEAVLTEALRTLLFLRERNSSNLRDPEVLKQFFDSKNVFLRAYSAALHLENTGRAEEAMKRAGDEKNLFAKTFIWNQLAKHAGKLPETGLTAMLAAKSDTDRAFAAKHLCSGEKNPDAIPELAKAAGDGEPARVRLAVAEAAASRAQGGEKLLESLASDKSASVRAAVASAKHNEARSPILTRLTDDADWEVRRLAAVSLGDDKSENAVKALLELFGDKFLPVRDAAVASIAKIRPEKAEESLAPMLDAPDKMNAAVSSAGLLGLKNLAPKISSILAGNPKDDTSERCVEALGRLDFKEAADKVAAKASSPNPLLRRKTARALGALAQKQTFETLEKLAVDKDKDTALEALKAMGVIGDKSFVRILNQVADDVKISPDLRSASYWALGKIGDPSEKTLETLKKNFLKKIIPMEGMKAYDSDFARASALLALLDIAKKNSSVTAAAKETLKFFREDPFKQKGDDTPEIIEYTRQIELLANGEGKIEPSKVDYSRPLLTAVPAESGQQN